jgi:hypothetical protein
MKFSFSFTNKVGRLFYIYNQLNEIVSRKNMVRNGTCEPRYDTHSNTYSRDKKYGCFLCRCIIAI